MNEAKHDDDVDPKNKKSRADLLLCDSHYRRYHIGCKTKKTCWETDARTRTALVSDFSVEDRRTSPEGAADAGRLLYMYT